MAARSMADLFHDAINRKRFEPTKRRHDGAQSAGGYVGHRFAIKGGISLKEVQTRLLCEPQPLLKRLKHGG